MDIFFGVLLLLLLLIGLVLLVIGAQTVLEWFDGADERARIEQRGREAEARIHDIGRRARQAILDESLRQAATDGRPSATPPAGGWQVQPYIEGEWEEWR